MFDDRIKAMVGAATVKTLGRCGQGVLVADGYVLTAAHCVTWAADAGAAGGDFSLEEIETHTGERFLLAVHAVEPVSDIAVLGCVDDQSMPEEAMKFNKFCADVIPLQVAMDDYPFQEPFPIGIQTHDRGFISGTASHWGAREQANAICIEKGVAIRGGTSGGPVVDVIGRLAAIVSTASDDGGEDSDNVAFHVGLAPRPHLTLPVWIWNRIARSQSA